MSEKIQTQFAVKNLDMMERVLQKQNIDFAKNGDELRVSRSYHDIVINKDGISCDSMNQREVDNLKIQYSKDFAIETVEQQGEMYQVEEDSKAITILVG